MNVVREDNYCQVTTTRQLCDDRPPVLRSSSFLILEVQVYIIKLL